MKTESREHRCCEFDACNQAERKTLRVALGLNATMFLVGAIAGWMAHSSALIADSLDMLADAAAYATSLYTVGRSIRLRSLSASFSGSVVLILGVGVLLDVVRRAFAGGEPDGPIMIGVAGVSLAVNAYVLVRLGRHREQPVNLRASWLCTQADVLANIGVIGSGLLVLLLNSRVPDLVIGLVISVLVMRGGGRILREASRARHEAAAAAATRPRSRTEHDHD